MNAKFLFILLSAFLVSKSAPYSLTGNQACEVDMDYVNQDLKRLRQDLQVTQIHFESVRKLVTPDKEYRVISYFFNLMHGSLNKISEILKKIESLQVFLPSSKSDIEGSRANGTLFDKKKVETLLYYMNQQDKALLERLFVVNTTINDFDQANQHLLPENKRSNLLERVQQ